MKNESEKAKVFDVSSVKVKDGGKDSADVYDVHSVEVKPTEPKLSKEISSDVAETVRAELHSLTAQLQTLENNVENLEKDKIKEKIADVLFQLRHIRSEIN